MGVVALLAFPQYGVVSAALSFGLLHIIFGLYILGKQRQERAWSDERDRFKPDDIDAVIHERVRLAIVSALAVSPELSFNELKAMLELTDGNLSAHSRTLDEAGYIVIEKSFQGPTPAHHHAADAQGPQGFRALPGDPSPDRRSRRPSHERFLVNTRHGQYFFCRITL